MQTHRANGVPVMKDLRSIERELKRVTPSIPQCSWPRLRSEFVLPDWSFIENFITNNILKDNSEMYSTLNALETSTRVDATPRQDGTSTGCSTNGPSTEIEALTKLDMKEGLIVNSSRRHSEPMPEIMPARRESHNDHIPHSPDSMPLKREWFHMRTISEDQLWAHQKVESQLARTWNMWRPHELNPRQWGVCRW